jgi:hypothetical protein
MHWSLWAELAAQRMSQELRDAEAARRARLAEEVGRRPVRGGQVAGRVFSWAWKAARAGYALARGVR